MKVQNPIIGRARGSAGGMTFSKVYDKNVARAKAFEVTNPKTSAQQIQRAFFAELTALCSDFSEELLRTLFPNKPKTMSRRNAITKQIAQSNTTVDGQKVIDYANIITLGNAKVMDFGDITVHRREGDLAVHLDESVINMAAYEDNYYFAAIINETQKQIYIPAVFATVGADNYAITEPENWLSDDTVHAIPFITNATSEEQVADGFGTLIVINRPARTND